MLEVSTLRRSPSKADHHGDGGFTDCCGEEDFMVDDNLLDYIDFTSCCNVVPSFFDADGDILPDLEVDPTELLAEFELSPSSSPCCPDDGGAAAETKHPDESPAGGGKDDEKKRLVDEKEGQRTKKKKKKKEGDEVLTTEDSASAATAPSSDDTDKSSVSAEGQSKNKTKPSKKNSNGKRKVDWTPELHRRFVQAVEQLGIDKAVPSRILEIMGMEGLTRHNIASHLQKYRSHRKHLMAREAEAATWAQKRQTMYAAAAAATGWKVAGAPPGTTKDMPAAAGGPWIMPTVGFPPPPPPPPGFCRPLHVWGHPPTGVDPMLPVWPRHLAPPRPWAPMVDPAYWHQQYNAARKWGPQTVTRGTPCVPPQMPPPAMLPRFPAPAMLPHPMYRPIPPPAQSSKLASLQLQLNAHPSKESIDAAIGDVLVKPWLPLPLGLKPPSLDSVMSELHKQGIPKIPPVATTRS